MAGINKVILLGRLGKDPEVNYTPDGTAVATFSVATSREWKDKSTGEKRELVEWTRVVAWRKLAQICGEYLAKGRQVYIEGRMQTRSWEKDGTTHYANEVIANEVQFIGGRADSNQDRRRDPGDYPKASAGRGPAPAAGNTMEDDIPF
jgi:single-strand DNA-binding protein